MSVFLIYHSIVYLYENLSMTNKEMKHMIFLDNLCFECCSLSYSKQKRSYEVLYHYYYVSFRIMLQSNLPFEVCCVCFQDRPFSFILLLNDNIYMITSMYDKSFIYFNLDLLKNYIYMDTYLQKFTCIMIKVKYQNYVNIIHNNTGMKPNPTQRHNSDVDTSKGKYSTQSV